MVIHLFFVLIMFLYKKTKTLSIYFCLLIYFLAKWKFCNILCGFMILMIKLVFFSLIYYSRKGKQKFVVIYFVCSYFLYKYLAVQKSSVKLYYVVFCSNLLINIVNYLIVIILYSLYYGHTFG